MTHAPSRFPSAPLLLDGSLHETIWGGRHLAAVAGKRLPAAALIGESWETALESVVRTAPYAGATLGEVVERYGEALLGWRAVEIFGRRFPLLTKFLDAHQQLSVQVHPDDTYAAIHEGGTLGKTECWYILQAEPGARLVHGLRRPATLAEVRVAISETRLEDLLHTFEAHAGDVIFVPAGTVHAIGGGIVLYELQEYSDVTYRLYDYGRLQANGQPRELHVERGLAVMHAGPSAATHAVPLELPPGTGLALHRVLVACDYFILEELRLEGSRGSYHSTVQPSSVEILSILDGSCFLEAQGTQLGLTRGDTVVLPASLGAYSLSGASACVARSYVPTADAPLLTAWRRAQSVATSS
jgi:mannose-6-phosphate isomerase